MKLRIIKARLAGAEDYHYILQKRSFLFWFTISWALESYPLEKKAEQLILDNGKDSKTIFKTFNTTHEVA